LEDASIIDSGINPPTDISKVEGIIIDVNELAAINAEGAKIYDRIINPSNENNKNKVMEVLNGYYKIFYKDR